MTETTLIYFLTASFCIAVICYLLQSYFKDKVIEACKDLINADNKYIDSLKKVINTQELQFTQAQDLIKLQEAQIALYKESSTSELNSAWQDGYNKGYQEGQADYRSINQ